jgi:hypothetical protein
MRSFFTFCASASLVLFATVSVIRLLMIWLTPPLFAIGGYRIGQSRLECNDRGIELELCVLTTIVRGPDESSPNASAWEQQYRSKGIMGEGLGGMFWWRSAIIVTRQ